MNNDIEAQNAMLEHFKATHPAFGPKPTHTAPVFRTDAERLEECRRALGEILKLAFDGKDEWVHKEWLDWIRHEANVALARTSKAETMDTIP